MNGMKMKCRVKFLHTRARGNETVIREYCKRVSLLRGCYRFKRFRIFGDVSVRKIFYLILILPFKMKREK